MEKVKIITNCKDTYLLRLMRRISNLSIKRANELENKFFIVDVGTVPDTVMRELNFKYRGLNRTTTSLSFPYMESWKDGRRVYVNLGQIFISLETVKRRAKLHKRSFEREFVDTYLHAFLHLLGYDHKTSDEREVMRSIHDEIVREIWGEF